MWEGLDVNRLCFINFMFHTRDIVKNKWGCLAIIIMEIRIIIYHNQFKSEKDSGPYIYMYIVNTKKEGEAVEITKN